MLTVTTSNLLMLLGVTALWAAYIGSAWAQYRHARDVYAAVSHMVREATPETPFRNYADEFLPSCPACLHGSCEDGGPCGRCGFEGGQA